MADTPQKMGANTKPRKTFRRTLITGFFVVLPVLVTIWVIRFFITQIDSTITPFALHVIRLLGLGRWVEGVWVDWVAPPVSVALTTLAIYLVGLFGGNVLGQQILKSIDQLLLQVPVVRGIYSATRQFLDTFSRSGSSFSKVVLIEYPRAGSWTLAFVTNEEPKQIPTPTDEKLMAVFVPTTPNPTSGFMLFVPKTKVTSVDISVDDAFRMIVSAGVLSPNGSANEAQKAS